jgi:hypothetical protein
MKSKYIAFILIVIVLSIWAQSAFAQDSLQFFSDLKLGKMFGSTKYHIHVQEYIPIYNGSTPLRVDSELEFPLDSYIFEANLGGNMKVKEKYKIGAEGSFFTNMNNPGGTMLDSDWASLPMFNREIKFSYTESEAEARIYGWNVNGRIGYLLSDQLTSRSTANTLNI